MKTRDGAGVSCNTVEQQATTGDVVIDVLRAFAASRCKAARLDSAIKKTAKRRKTTPDAVRRALLAAAGKSADAILDYHIARALTEWRSLELSRFADVVEFKGIEAARRDFKIAIKLDIAARVALGVIARHNPLAIDRDLSEMVCGALGELCARSPARRLAFEWAMHCVRWGKDDAGNFGIAAAPDMMAMPDDAAPCGFVMLADNAAVGLAAAAPDRTGGERRSR